MNEEKEGKMEEGQELNGCGQGKGRRSMQGRAVKNVSTISMTSETPVGHFTLAPASQHQQIPL